MKERVTEELKKHFRPEFINRLDEIIVFHELSMDELKSIVDLMLERVRAQLANQHLDLVLTDDAKEYLGYPRLRPRAGGETAAKGHPAPARGPAVGAGAARVSSRPGRPSWSTSTPRTTSCASKGSPPPTSRPWRWPARSRPVPLKGPVRTTENMG